jgi:hypothetical protein
MDKVTGVVLLTMLVSTDSSAQTRAAAGVVVVDGDGDEPHPCLAEPVSVVRDPHCLRSHDYRPRTQFVTEMLRSAEEF